MTPDPALGLFANFERTAKAHPQQRAFTFLTAHLDESAYTFEQLFAAVTDVARALAPLHLPAELPVAILAGTQEQQVVHYLAVMSLGLTPAILTPPHRKLNREYYLRTTRAIFEYAQFSAVITDVSELDVNIPTLEPRTCRILQERPCRGGGDQEGAVNGSAFLQFSSGTTGIKRGVLVSNEAAISQILAYSDAIGLDGNDSIVSWLPLYHDMGFITSLNMPMACGVHSVMIPPVDWVTDPSLYIRAVSRYRGTLSWHPNFAFAFMAGRVRESQLRGVTLESLRGMVNCSEPVTKQSQDRFEKRFVDYGLHKTAYLGCYAMAETTFALTHGQSSDPGYYDSAGAPGFAPRSAAEPFVSVGRALPGVTLAVASDDGMLLPERTVGELRVKSPFNLTAYYNNPAATSAALQDGWYKTGDLGYRAQGEYFVCGRKKDLLIIAGVNIAPQDVEDAASGVHGIQPGRVSVFSDFDACTQTERAVILAETAAPERERPSIAVNVRQRIAAEFQMTSFDVFLVAPGWLVKSSAGKIARRANRDKWKAQAFVEESVRVPAEP